jgi:hypothetical protein
MKANPDKFQAIAIGPKTNRHNLSFDLKGNKITCEANVKLYTLLCVLWVKLLYLDA